MPTFSRFLRLTPSVLIAVIVLIPACAQEPAEAPAPPPPEPAAAPPPPEPAAAVISIPNARTPTPGVLVGGQPTAEQLAEAGEAGYRTVVDLRTEGEDRGIDDEAALVESLGMRYVPIPTPGADGLTEDNVRALAEVLDDPANAPVMVHCGSGNRVGALFALKAHQLDGTDAETALEVGRESGLTRLEGAVRGLLGLDEPAAGDE